MREQKTPGRPREFDTETALYEIMNLFWQSGYEGTSLSDIMEATGLRKASLYAAFGNKHEMYLKALGQYEAEMVDTGCAALRGAGASRDRLAAFLSAPIEAAWDNGDRRGCFLCNASADQGALDTETAAMVRRGYEKMERALRDVMREILPDERDAAVIAQARLMLTVYSGLRVMARTSDDRAQLEQVRDGALATLG